MKTTGGKITVPDPSISPLPPPPLQDKRRRDNSNIFHAAAADFSAPLPAVMSSQILSGTSTLPRLFQLLIFFIVRSRSTNYFNRSAENLQPKPLPF
jgi:hypothetical protein